MFVYSRKQQGRPISTKRTDEQRTKQLDVHASNERTKCGNEQQHQPTAMARNGAKPTYANGWRPKSFHANDDGKHESTVLKPKWFE